jgi:DNA replication protein DnaC
MTEIKYPFHEEYQKASMPKIIQEDEIINKLNAWYKKPQYLFYFTGKVGTGKTYFAASIYNLCVENKVNVRAFTEANFLSHLREGMDKIDAIAEVNRLCECDVFILDDLGSSSMTAWQKENLFTMVDIRCSMKRPTLITSNLLKQDLHDTFSERFSSRIYAARNVVVTSMGEDRRLDINFGKTDLTPENNQN